MPDWATVRCHDPATLQDSLMARLDQLNAAKEVAQLWRRPGAGVYVRDAPGLGMIEEATLQEGWRNW